MSISSETMYTSFHSFAFAFGGARMSTRPSTLSCLKCLRILISRSSRLQSMMSSNAFGIFLIATGFDVSTLRPEQTRPYAP